MGVCWQSRMIRGKGCRRPKNCNGSNWIQSVHAETPSILGRGTLGARSVLCESLWFQGEVFCSLDPFSTPSSWYWWYRIGKSLDGWLFDGAAARDPSSSARRASCLFSLCNSQLSHPPVNMSSTNLDCRSMTSWASLEGLGQRQAQGQSQSQKNTWSIAVDSVYKEPEDRSLMKMEDSVAFLYGTLNMHEQCAVLSSVVGHCQGHYQSFYSVRCNGHTIISRSSSHWGSITLLHAALDVDL